MMVIVVAIVVIDFTYYKYLLDSMLHFSALILAHSPSLPDSAFS